MAVPFLLGETTAKNGKIVWWNMMKPRSEVWLQNYNQSRYLKPLSREALAERLRWLIENIATLDEEGQIGAVQPNADQEQERLWIAFTHTMQEFWLRGQNPPDQFLANAKMPTPSYPSPPRELAAYQGRKRSDPGQIFKYGKKAHLSKLLTTGEAKVRPASSYKDPSLNYAVSDDELQFTIQPKVSDLRLVTAHGSVTTATINYASFVLAHSSDFYVYCMASQFALRLFKDFEADSCLIVYDRTEFTKRFRKALESKLPDWKFIESYVSYVDPNNPGPHAPIIPISKHLRFVYQREFRLIFHPRIPIPPPLEDVDIELRPCGDIAELIDVNQR